MSLKKLREEILLATDQETYEQIKNATWFDRELRAFELYNAEKNLCDELMNYHFADWLINACGKYQAREQSKNQILERRSESRRENQILLVQNRFTHLLKNFLYILSLQANTLKVTRAMNNLLHVSQ